MSRARFPHRAAGLSLVELMVAMALGLIVAGGFVSVFLATSSSHRLLTQLALLQESGRFAIDRLTRDLRRAGAFYCGQAGDVPMVQASDLIGALHDVTARWSATPTAPYRFPPFLRMHGHECGGRRCSPEAPAGLPAMGRGVGQRVIGADVLTVRYLDAAAGWAVRGVAAIAGGAEGTIHHLVIQPGEGEPAVADIYQAGDLLMLADCPLTQIFSANRQGDAFYPDALETGRNLALPLMPPSFNLPRLFDVRHDFHTVTYYLQVVDAGDGVAIGALMRRENGAASEIVRGVERMDFLYGVEDADGATRYLSAAQVDDRVGGIVACASTVEHGCLWRAVKSIEVHLLLDGQQVHGALAASAGRYAYSIDGDVSPTSPDATARAVRPTEQGFDPRMLRREFSTLVAVRGDGP